MGERIATRLRALVQGAPSPAPTDEDRRAFIEYCAARMRARCSLTFAVVVAFTVVWWPTDPFIYADLPPETTGTFAVLRLIIIGSGLVYALLAYATPLRRHPLAIFSVLAVGVLFAVGVTMARLGGPDRPWIYFVYAFPFTTVSLPLTLAPRAALTVALSVASLVGIVATEPAHMSNAFAPMMISFMVCVVLVSIAAGHVLFLALADSHGKSQALARAKDEIRGYCDRLEDKVTERTHELRRLLAELETAREDERAFISRELHDQLGQELVAQRYALAFTRRRYDDAPTAIGRNLMELEDLQVRMAATVRALVTTLRPVVLDDLGLKAALAWLLRQTGDRAGVECALTVDGDEAVLTGEQPIALYRIAQEAVTNALRHAAPARIAVSVRLGPDELALTVEDDGAGFDPDLPRALASTGLLGMRERADALGGTLTVDSQPGAGTTVRLRVPLAARASEEPRARDDVRVAPPPAAPPAVALEGR